jgi:hypothetical protein
MVFSQERQALRDRYPDLPWSTGTSGPTARPGQRRGSARTRPLADRLGRLRRLTLRLRALA